MTIVGILGIVLLMASAEGLIRLGQLFKYGSAVSYERLYRLNKEIELRKLFPTRELDMSQSILSVSVSDHSRGSA